MKKLLLIVLLLILLSACVDTNPINVDDIQSFDNIVIDSYYNDDFGNRCHTRHFEDGYKETECIPIDN